MTAEGVPDGAPSRFLPDEGGRASRDPWHDPSFSRGSGGPDDERMKPVRVAALQYFIRPVQTFSQFEEQVIALVETAVDYQARLVLFPEWFSVQLLTLGDLHRPIRDQVRDLAAKAPRLQELFTRLATKHGVYLVAGTFPVLDEATGKVFNQCCFVGPSGRTGLQRKLHMTRFESEEWAISPGTRLHVFRTEIGSIAITICYDVEFPELARAAARSGAEILLVPSCTDDRQGYLRVRYCAQARAIENQLFVMQASTVGSLPMVPAVSLNYGQAAILTPSDFSFSRDGILAEGVPNQESMVIGDLHLSLVRESRSNGTVLPLRDSQSTADVVSKLEVVEI
jgi:predicted amidohydrolase